MPTTMIDPKLILIAEGRGRKEFRNLDKLMDSISRLGVIHPLVVKPRSDGMFELIAGERRYRALCLLGRKEFPITLKEDISPTEMKEIELEENLCREDLQWDEQCELLRQLDELKRKSNPGWEQGDTASLTGSSPPAVSRDISLARQMKERPDLADRIRHLPKNVASRKIEQFKEQERLQRLEDKGLLEKTSSLHLGDAIEYLKTLPDESVDLIVTDPPYGIGEIERERGKSRGTIQTFLSEVAKSDNLNKEKVMWLLRDTLPEMIRVLKPSGHFYIFFDIPLYQGMVDLLAPLDCWVDPVPLIWDKGRPSAPFRGFTYMPCYEPILFGHKMPREKMLISPSKKILLFTETDAKEMKKHPFQKPQCILKYLIEQSSNIGDVVLDPFAGSGSTLIAAKRSGRSGIGSELNKDHYLNALSLLEKEL